MAQALPTVGLNSDNLPGVLIRAGTPLKGDGQLHLLAGMPLRVNDVVAEATITTNATNSGFAAGDVTTLVNLLHNKHATVEGIGAPVTPKPQG